MKLPKLAAGTNPPLNGFHAFPMSVMYSNVYYATVDPDSQAITDWWGIDGLHVDCVVPYSVVANNTPFTQITIPENGSVPDHKQSYPFPDSNVFYAQLPAGDGWYQDPASGDCHGVIIECDTLGNPIHEVDYWYPWIANGKQYAQIAVRWNILGGDNQRQWLLTACSGSGMPLLPFMVTTSEALNGIPHALGVTLAPEHIAGWYTPPASHPIWDSKDSRARGVGTRIRLKQHYDTSVLPLVARNVANALKTYGAIIYDAGADLFIPGASDLVAYQSQLEELRANVTSADFEVIYVPTDKRFTWKVHPPC